MLPFSLISYRALCALLLFGVFKATQKEKKTISLLYKKTLLVSENVCSTVSLLTFGPPKNTGSLVTWGISPGGHFITGTSHSPDTVLAGAAPSLHFVSQHYFYLSFKSDYAPTSMHTSLNLPKIMSISWSFRVWIIRNSVSIILVSIKRSYLGTLDRFHSKNCWYSLSRHLRKIVLCWHNPSRRMKRIKISCISILGTLKCKS